jgi:predicted cytidylate kinase
MDESGPLHICISGDLGSGKSSVARLVARDLAMELVSTGDIQRAIAQSLQASTLETNLIAEKDRSIDDQVDSVTKRLDRESTTPLIFDSRMAWWFVRRALKVRLIVDPEVSVRRILEREPNAVESYVSVEDARSQVAARFTSESKRFLTRYGANVAWLANFDLVLDSSDTSAERIAAEVASQYRAAVQIGMNELQLFVSPRRLLPAFKLVEGASDPASVSVGYVRPFTMAFSGQETLQHALDTGVDLIPARLVGQDDEQLAPGVSTRSALELLDAGDIEAWARRSGADLGSFLAWQHAPR